MNHWNSCCQTKQVSNLQQIEQQSENLAKTELKKNRKRLNILLTSKKRSITKQLSKLSILQTNHREHAKIQIQKKDKSYPQSQQPVGQKMKFQGLFLNISDDQSYSFADDDLDLSKLFPNDTNSVQTERFSRKLLAETKKSQSMSQLSVYRSGSGSQGFECGQASGQVGKGNFESKNNGQINQSQKIPNFYHLNVTSPRGTIFSLAPQIQSIGGSNNEDGFSEVLRSDNYPQRSLKKSISQIKRLQEFHNVQSVYSAIQSESISNSPSDIHDLNFKKKKVHHNLSLKRAASGNHLIID